MLFELFSKFDLYILFLVPLVETKWIMKDFFSGNLSSPLMTEISLHVKSKFKLNLSNNCR